MDSPGAADSDSRNEYYHRGQDRPPDPQGTHILVSKLFLLSHLYPFKHKNRVAAAAGDLDPTIEQFPELEDAVVQDESGKLLRTYVAIMPLCLLLPNVTHLG